MKYLSIDIETTGLDPDVNQMIEVGAVLADTADFSTPVDELPSFRALIPYENYTINTFCMSMHKELWPELDEAAGALSLHPNAINKGSGVWYTSPRQLQSCFRNWLREHDLQDQKLTVAGKNFFGFDHKFLAPFLPDVEFHHRSIDPVMLFARPEDKKLPDLKTCCQRAFINLEGHHSAVADAKTVVRLVRCGLAA